MPYINIVTLEIVNFIHQIKAKYPNTSFPENPTSEMLKPFGYAILHTHVPEYDDRFQYVTYDSPFYNEETGQYEFQYTIQFRDVGECKQNIITAICDAFKYEEEHGHVMSSLGFEIDANRKSITDVVGLLRLFDNKFVDMTHMVDFRDYIDVDHSLGYAQLKDIEMEITLYGLAIYQRKWNLLKEVDAVCEQILSSESPSYELYEKLYNITWKADTTNLLS